MEGLSFYDNSNHHHHPCFLPPKALHSLESEAKEGAKLKASAPQAPNQRPETVMSAHSIPSFKSQFTVPCSITSPGIHAYCNGGFKNVSIALQSRTEDSLKNTDVWMEFPQVEILTCAQEFLLSSSLACPVDFSLAGANP